MFKNVKIKRVLKSTVFKMLTVVNKVIPKDDKIVMLYSPNHGIEHNLKPLKDYLIEKKYNRYYKIICCVSSSDYYENDGLKYIKQIKGFLVFLTAKRVFYTTGQIPIKPSTKQIVIHLDHGAAGFKTFGALSGINNGYEYYFTYYMAPSDLYVKIAQEAFDCPESSIIVNDEPVADVLLSTKIKYDLGDYKRIGIWMPTFRQSSYLGYSDSSESNLLPLFNSYDYYSLNKRLEELDIKLIVKIHSAQDMKENGWDSFTNLLLITDKIMNERGWSLYPLMSQMDFLISDYSSAYLQFLLLNRPVSFVVPDYEEYIATRGSVFDHPKEYMPGDFITTQEEMYSFLKKMSDGIDDYQKEREKVCSIIHKYRDPCNCDRLMKICKMQDFATNN